jgi:hypothetical protein
MSTIERWTIHAATGLAAVACIAWLGESAAGTQSPQDGMRQRSITAEKQGLAEPFKGVTTGGSIAPDLFGIKSTGVSTDPVRKAADAFLAALTPEQRGKTAFGVDDDEWRKWMNQHFYVRQGVSFQELSAAQRESGFALLRAALSARGLKQTRDIMKLNETLGELNNDLEQYGEWRYHLTVMGKPSATEPWGWQFDGHHAVINYFVLGDQVVMTPYFAGSEPVIAKAGKFKGTSIMEQEQSAALTTINSLDASQRAKAVLKVSKTGNEILTEAWRDNVVLDYAGIPASALSPAQRQQLLALVDLYIGNMEEGHAKVKMAEVERYLDRTYLAWIGGTTPGSVFYYRIHSPVVLIEFDHQRPANLRHLNNPELPNAEHVHAIVRTPNGNDYGKDLLRLHYQQHPH